jgi:hypothetical protein
LKNNNEVGGFTVSCFMTNDKAPVRKRATGKKIEIRIK